MWDTQRTGQQRGLIRALIMLPFVLSWKIFTNLFFLYIGLLLRFASGITGIYDSLFGKQGFMGPVKSKEVWSKGVQRLEHLPTEIKDKLSEMKESVQPAGVGENVPQKQKQKPSFQRIYSQSVRQAEAQTPQEHTNLPSKLSSRHAPSQYGTFQSVIGSEGRKPKPVQFETAKPTQYRFDEFSFLSLGSEARKPTQYEGAKPQPKQYETEKPTQFRGDEWLQARTMTEDRIKQDMQSYLRRLVQEDVHYVLSEETTQAKPEIKKEKNERYKRREEYLKGKPTREKHEKMEETEEKKEEHGKVAVKEGLDVAHIIEKMEKTQAQFEEASEAAKEKKPQHRRGKKQRAQKEGKPHLEEHKQGAEEEEEEHFEFVKMPKSTSQISGDEEILMAEGIKEEKKALQVEKKEEKPGPQELEKKVLEKEEKHEKPPAMRKKPEEQKEEQKSLEKEQKPLGLEKEQKPIQEEKPTLPEQKEEKPVLGVEKKEEVKLPQEQDKGLEKTEQKPTEHEKPPAMRKKPEEQKEEQKGLQKEQKPIGSVKEQKSTPEEKILTEHKELHGQKGQPEKKDSHKKKEGTKIQEHIAEKHGVASAQKAESSQPQQASQ